MIKSRLKVILAENDMTQKQLCEKTGIRPSTVSDICNSKMKHIPVTILNDLCKLFSCQVGDIFKYEDNEKS
jgi:putative transcriptional regulator